MTDICEHGNELSGFVTTGNVQIDVFWVVTTCNNVVGYQRFGGP